MNRPVVLKISASCRPCAFRIDFSPRRFSELRIDKLRLRENTKAGVFLIHTMHRPIDSRRSVFELVSWWEYPVRSRAARWKCKNFRPTILLTGWSRRWRAPRTRSTCATSGCLWTANGSASRSCRMSNSACRSQSRGERLRQRHRQKFLSTPSVGKSLTSAYSHWWHPSFVLYCLSRMLSRLSPTKRFFKLIKQKKNRLVFPSIILKVLLMQFRSKWSSTNKLLQLIYMNNKTKTLFCW